MENSGEDRERICPYFVKEMNSCSSSRDGIYLPPQVHVLTYCLSSMYEECAIYKQFCPVAAEKKSNTFGDLEDRRAFNRVNEQKKVLIRTSSPQGIVVGDFVEMALTLDYSKGGMRIALDKEIPANTLLLFDFDDDFLIPRFQGLASLRWHRKIDGNDYKVEAGLEFRDKYSKRVLELAFLEGEWQ